MRQTIMMFGVILAARVAAAAPAFCQKLDADAWLEKSRVVSLAAKHHSNLREKSRLAGQGITFANKCLYLARDNAGCYYYRAVNRGIELGTRVTRIKKDLNRMIADFEKVTHLAPAYDQGGAYRALGYVYLKLPVIPTGTGRTRDLVQARAYGEKALRSAPGSPDNRLLLGLIYFKERRFDLAIENLSSGLLTSQQIKNPSMDDLSIQHELEKFLQKARKKNN